MLATPEASFLARAYASQTRFAIGGALMGIVARWLRIAGFEGVHSANTLAGEFTLSWCKQSVHKCAIKVSVGEVSEEDGLGRVMGSRGEEGKIAVGMGAADDFGAG